MDAKALRTQGMSYEEIGRALGMDWRTAKKLCSESEPPMPQTRERSPKLDPFRPVLDAWLEKRPVLPRVQLLPSQWSRLSVHSAVPMLSSPSYKGTMYMANLISAFCYIPNPRVILSLYHIIAQIKRASTC